MINSLEGKLGHEKVKSEGSSKNMQKGEAEGERVESNKIEEGKSYSYSYPFFPHKNHNTYLKSTAFIFEFELVSDDGFYYCDVSEEQKVLI